MHPTILLPKLLITVHVSFEFLSTNQPPIGFLTYREYLHLVVKPGLHPCVPQPHLPPCEGRCVISYRITGTVSSTIWLYLKFKQVFKHA